MLISLHWIICIGCQGVLQVQRLTVGLLFENYLKFDEKGRLCIIVCGYLVPFHYVSKMGQTTKEFHVSRDQFNDILISVRHNLIQIAQSLSSDIRE